MAQKEQCFIITPIGDENSEIRRHIEGIIDAVIKPALEEWYEIEVAHRISTPGSITKQIIEAIYNSKLVIANLTNCNPNVMYELALRHGIGKPVIMIAEDGTRLPSDVMMQRTIFYRNDAMGVLKLREDLRDTASKIDFEKPSGLVFEALGEISHDAAMLNKAAEQDSNSREPLEYIMRRLDQIESSLTKRGSENVRKRRCTSSFALMLNSSPMDIPGELFVALDAEMEKRGCEVLGLSFSENEILMKVEYPVTMPRHQVVEFLWKIMNDNGYPCDIVG